KVYIANYGSRNISIIDEAAIESSSGGLNASAVRIDLAVDGGISYKNDDIGLIGGGPAGLALHESESGATWTRRLFVYTRFDNRVSLYNVDDNVSPSKLASAVLFSPEPSAIFEGRPFLYDARIRSEERRVGKECESRGRRREYNRN